MHSSLLEQEFGKKNIDPPLQDTQTQQHIQQSYNNSSSKGQVRPRT